MENKKISLFSMVFFGVCSVLVLYTVAANASKGVQGLGVWFVIILLFLIPSCLVISELGSTWSENGGIYIWTKRAFGDFVSSQVAWLYWANTLFTNPLSSVTLIGVTCSYFLPNASNITQMFMVIGFLWCIAVIGIVNSEVTQKLASYGGTVILILLSLISIGGIMYGLKYGFANNFTLGNFKPTLSLMRQFGPVVIFNILGVELLSSVAGRMDNPKKNVPKFIITTGLLVAVLYILGSVSILSVIPVEKINSVSGFIDATKIIVIGLLGPNFSFVSTLIVIAFIYAMIASGIGWALGTSYVISTTGLDQQSKILGHINKKYGTPDYVYIITAAFGTVYVAFNYLGGSNIQAIFWVIFSFSSMIFLAPYLFMYPAVIKLRYKEPDIERPYKIPGGMVGVWFCGGITTLGIIGSIIGFSMPPAETVNPLMYELKMWVGFAIVVLFGVGLYLKNARKAKKKVEMEKIG
ncbi:amino acid permease [Clostridium carboxidivorans P7]|uniref:Amino acid permease-associated region n=1 Tax=Clostridium carboxidivorans P7 TaxID=536227 RepID=C6Q0N6_9CLOT|nr:APC family permease [Clostridium carboxidivorans]AKN31601.1 amino acid permease [Clostridium carboxidivorans P7]EET84951.1 amino acid permease-associated region [Clostridium carboxidivorans P7]EFG86985.1 amino acid permease [Clostridium carboxidivorans P7]